MITFCTVRLGFGCYCDPSGFATSEKSIRTAAQDAAVVLRGEVIGLRPASNDVKSGNAIATLQIEESWRGPENGTIDIATVDNNCRFNFNIGDDYIVYAYNDAEGAFTTLCSRTQEADRAAFDLEYLRRAPISAAPPRGAQINTVH